MAFVDWSEEALQNLADHDAWRVENGWDPISLEIQDEVNAFFAEHDPDQPPHFLPGRSATRNGEPVGLRVKFIPVRSKQFQVFFRYEAGVFQIRRVHHPRSK